MASFNKVILMGNLTRDPEVRAAGTAGNKVARLRLAVNERRKDRNGQPQDFTVYVDVEAWDKLAELCGQYLSKGRSVLVDGRLQMDEWEKDGIKHQKLKVRAIAIKFIGQYERQNNQSGPSQFSGFRPQQPSGAPQAFGQNPLEGDPDDIPF